MRSRPPAPMAGEARPSAVSRADEAELTRAAPDRHDALRATEERFAEATVNGALRRRYEVAGFPVELRFAGEEMLQRLSRAFAHLASASTGKAMLTIDLWDSQTSGTQPPPLPAAEIDEAARGAVVHFADGPVHALYQPALRTLQILDAERGHAWFWAEDVSALPEWECATPIRHVLHWWLAGRGVQQLHAAAVGTPSGGVLMVGRGGSGKSTVALASLAAGLLYAGDDYVAASAGPDPFVHSLYSSGKLEPHHIERFPHLAGADRIEPETDPAAAPFDRNKTVVYISESHMESTTAGFPIRAILIPRIVGEGETHLSDVPRPRALVALAPSTIVQLHTAGQDAFGSMRDLVDRVPTFELALGAEVTDAPNVIRELLESLDRE